ncbi:MAG: hypothetical protein E7184_02995 [Erysipelotrichaceae bacterium]|nr:hypothetical protein [Erysipelotrichaceae bacterium]
MKKGLTIGTLIGLGLCALMLILSILGISFFKGTRLDLLLIVATLTVGGYFSISSAEVLKRNKTLGIVSTSLIGVAVVLVISTVLFDTGSVFGDVTFTFALLSVLFNFIVSTKLKLGNKQFLVQIGSYSILSIFILLCVLSIFGVLKIGDILSVFLILLVLSIVSFVTVSVLANKSADYVSEEYVKITKKEYEELKEKAKKYDELKGK